MNCSGAAPRPAVRLRRDSLMTVSDASRHGRLAFQLKIISVKPVSGARSCGSTQLSSLAWRRSAPTSPTGSRKPRTRAGSARSPRSRPPWPPPHGNLKPCATSPSDPRARAFTSACRTSVLPPGDTVRARDVPRPARRQGEPGRTQCRIEGVRRFVGYGSGAAR
jgi:hypothetical protein